MATRPAPHRHESGNHQATRPSTGVARTTPTGDGPEQYTGAFARVRLVRAWIGVAAAMVALGYAFASLLDRVLP